MGSSSKKQKEKLRKKKESLFDNLQLLRAVTNSSATNKESIIVDATKYIEELKEKVERLSHDEDRQYYSCTTHELASFSSLNSNLPTVNVETLEKGGFLINVVSENNCPGLLVWILEAFHELGLDVLNLDARVSSSDTFQLQAVGGGGGGDKQESMDGEMVKEAVEEAINNWNATTGAASTTSPDHDDLDQNDDT